MKEKLQRMEAKLDSWGETLEKKNIRYPSDLVTGIVFLVLAVVVLLVMPQQVQVSEKDVVNGRAFPTLMVYVMMACSALLVIKDVYKLATRKPIEMKTMNLLVEVKALIIMGILIVTYFLAKWTDLFVIGGVFCALAFLVFFRCKKRSYYVITLTMAVAIWVVFRFVLGVDF